MQKILVHQLQPTEQVRNHYALAPLPGTQREDLLEPGAWAHVVKQRALGRGDRVDALAADGSWHTSLIVLEVNDLGVRMGELSFTEFPLPVADTRPVEIAFAGPTAKWRVVRDRIVIADGFATKMEAQQWIAAPASTAAPA